MKFIEKNVMRLVAVQHLRSVYGIKTKNWNKNKGVSCKTTASSSTKVFGVSLETLPYYNMESGSVPSFLVDACMKLQAHVDTEGLFRKSGSVIRLKALRAKLDAGEECLSTALPCDIAGLVKQFFRELPEPVLPTELQEAFIKAQQLPTEEDRIPAIMLLSCVLPDRNLSVLRHFFEFLHNVSQRSAENKMNSSNLSVILAPNLLHSGDGTEKMNANTEKRLKLQAAVVQCFIENAFSFGTLPQFLQEKVPAMMGCEARAVSPTRDELVELDLNSGMKRRQRRSFGDLVNGALNKIKTNRTPTHTNQSDSLVFSSATPVIETPTSKRKLPLESGHSFGFSNKKRRSVKKTLGIDLLPNTLFSAVSTPGSAYSASGVLDSSQNAPSPAGRSRRQSVTSVRRKSRRLSKRHAVNRVESGKAGCFSPKASKKEAPRKSLRLRFSLGKSSKEAGSESIGLRLATQDRTTSFCFTEETEFSPSVVLRNTECVKKNKMISKSEDNLLTPQYDSSTLRTSWCGETPAEVQAFGGRSFSNTPMSMCLRKTHVSEPAIVVSKPPVVSIPLKLCCASSSQSLESESEPQNQTGPTPLEEKMASTESGRDPQASASCSPTPPVVNEPSDDAAVLPPETPTITVLSPSGNVHGCLTKQGVLAGEQNITFGQFEIAALTPLHIDSVIFESAIYGSPALKSDDGGCAAPVSPNVSIGGDGESEAEEVNCSRLIDALDVQSPARFKLGVSSGRQSTPHKPGLALGTPLIGTTVDAVRENPQDQMAQCSLETEQRHVADHIQHFNKLTLHSPRVNGTKRIKSPLRFERTPVRQAVRRINSMLGESRRPTRSNQVAKAVSMESGLSPHPQRQPHQGAPPPARQNTGRKKPPPVPPKKPSAFACKPRPCALGDMTNKVPTNTKADSALSEASGAARPLVQHMAEKEMNHYRGSPRNPLNQARLLSATKPVDL